MPLAVCLDGVYGHPDSLRVSVLDRGFLYGDGVFEVLRTYQGEPFALGAHLGRLAQGLGLLEIALPVPLETLTAEVYETLRIAGNAESYVRVTVTRGEARAAGLDPSLAGAPTRVILVGPLELPTAARYRTGIAVGLVRVPTLEGLGEASAVELRGAKTLNYLSNIVAQRMARARGYDEALCLGAGGRVLEAASANVFVVRAGVLSTPDEPESLPGITRSLVLDLVRAAGMECRVEPLGVEALGTADEVFLTSSVREVMPVTAVEGRAVGAGVPGPVTRRVHGLYRGQTPWRQSPMPWE